MESSFFSLLLADVLLYVHVLFVLFVIVGLIIIYAGEIFSWSWVKNPWFRLIHMVAIGIVVLQSWLGVICPLTHWEMSLRSQSSEAVYSDSFMAHWLGKLLYYQAPEWIFTLVYSLFFAVVIISWFLVRPRSFKLFR